MKLYTKLENHFKYLDECNLLENKILKSQANKERYESCIMFAFRKFQSLAYHLNNTITLLDKETELLAKKIDQLAELKDLKLIKITNKVKKDSYEFIYELSAFLAALKSCLDFLAEVSSFYLKGIKVNYSISPLLKLIKTRHSKILGFIKSNAKWINYICEYRHPIVHRLVINPQSGYEVHQLKNKSSQVLYPVLIPKTKPNFITDTRRHRIMDNDNDSLPNAIYSEEICTVTKNGVEEVLHFNVNIEPSDDYIRIEDFIKDHKSKCEDFFIALIEIFNELNFEYDNITQQSASVDADNASLLS